MNVMSKVTPAFLTIGLAVMLSLGRAQVQTPSPSFHEPYRPQFHFTPAKNWMNDPNGLVYYDGEYHLFFQHNPFGNSWGHMSWGHAVSKDLVNWKQLPVAIPEKPDHMIFSGCVVVDQNNTSGFGTDDKIPLVAVYTGYNPRTGHQAQYLAYSLDRARTFKFYEGAVLDLNSTDFRDPKVFPYGGEWRMIVSLPAQRKVRFYRSKDLKKWEYLSEFGPQGAYGGAWECPDIFELPVENRPGETRWVLEVDLDRRGYAKGSGGQYFVGRFDGTRFTVDSPALDRPLQPSPGRRFVPWDEEGNTSVLTTREETGKNSSEEFIIDDDFLNFQIQGGRDPQKLRLQLEVDGVPVTSGTGYISEQPLWTTWDVSPYRGREARLKLVDESQDLWGYLGVSEVHCSNQSLAKGVDNGRWIDFGPDFYATISFNNLKGRRVWLAWMNNWLYGQEIPTSPWRSAMSLPREICLKEVDGVMRLQQQPVAEFTANETDSDEMALTAVTPGKQVELASGHTGDMQLEWEPGGATELRLNVQGIRVSYRPSTGRLTADRGPGQVNFHPEFPVRSTTTLLAHEGPLKLRVIYDTSSVEVFADEGATCFTFRTFPQQVTTPNLECFGGSSGELRIQRRSVPVMVR